MALKFPKFEDTFCVILTVCSSPVEGQDPTAFLTERVNATAAFRAKSQKAFTRLLLLPDETPHLHIDVAVASAFAAPPETNETLTALRKKIEGLRGTKVKALVRGQCIVPLTSLPAVGGIIFAGGGGITIRQGKSQVELTGAQLDFHNAEIDRMRWELTSTGSVFLDIEATREVAINDDILADSMALVNRAIESYVLGRKSDEAQIS